MIEKIEKLRNRKNSKMTTFQLRDGSRCQDGEMICRAPLDSLGEKWTEKYTSKHIKFAYKLMFEKFILR